MHRESRWFLSNKGDASAFRRGARGAIDIVADILALCGAWTKRTRIMYKANLSHQMLKFYLWHIVELGLLEESGMEFKITEKGREFLSHYQNMTRLLEPGKSRHAAVAQNDSARE